MQVVVRADADAVMGIGHVARCLALCQALARAGADVVFATASDAPRVLELIAQSRVRVARVSARHPDPRDAGETAAIAADAVVVDGYAFDAGYLAAMKKAGRRVVAVDDLATVDLTAADIVLNPGPYAWHLPYALGRSTRWLGGSRFVLLRPEIVAARGTREPAAVVRRVLVSMGGSDPAQLTGPVLDALREELRALETRVVLGPASSGAEGVLAVVDRMRTDGVEIAAVTADARQMAEEMRAADLAIVAAGGTVWELASLGTPALTLISADNQRPVASAAHELGLAVPAGTGDGIEPDDLRAAFKALASDTEARAKMSARGRMLVDGAGAARAARAILTPDEDWQLRRAREDDVEAIWQINRDPAVRAQSFSKADIPLDAHIAWFEGKRQDPHSRLYVIGRDDAVGGQIRYDRRGEDGLVSFAVARALRGQGLGTRLLRETFALAVRELGLRAVQALVLDHNPASAKAFLSAGYQETGTRTVDGRQCLSFERRAAEAA